MSDPFEEELFSAVDEVKEICPHCGSDEVSSGYGLAGGGIGSYTFCMACDEIINKKQDCPLCLGEGVVEDQPSFENAWGEHGLNSQPCPQCEVSDEKGKESV